jgi:tRNA(Ile2) C34 agmatinyltransferase TiaS
MDDEISTFDTPNCPRCLVRLEVGGTEDHPYFVCPECRTAFLHDAAVD